MKTLEGLFDSSAVREPWASHRAQCNKIKYCREICKMKGNEVDILQNEDLTPICRIQGQRVFLQNEGLVPICRMRGLKVLAK